jgi:hypothetical protein
LRTTYGILATTHVTGGKPSRRGRPRRSTLRVYC